MALATKRTTRNLEVRIFSPELGPRRGGRLLLIWRAEAVKPMNNRLPKRSPPQRLGSRIFTFLEHVHSDSRHHPRGEQASGVPRTNDDDTRPRQTRIASGSSTPLLPRRGHHSRVLDLAYCHPVFAVENLHCDPVYVWKVIRAVWTSPCNETLKLQDALRPA